MTALLTHDELLVLLIEEAGEVIQAATKCLRFGYDTVGPDDYGRNDLVLAHEVGDMLGIVDALDLDARYLETSRENKLARAKHAKLLYGRAAGACE